MESAQQRLPRGLWLHCQAGRCRWCLPRAQKRDAQQSKKKRARLLEPATHTLLGASEAVHECRGRKAASAHHNSPTFHPQLAPASRQPRLHRHFRSSKASFPHTHLVCTAPSIALFGPHRQHTCRRDCVSASVTLFCSVSPSFDRRLSALERLHRPILGRALRAAIHHDQSVQEASATQGRGCRRRLQSRRTNRLRRLSVLIETSSTTRPLHCRCIRRTWLSTLAAQSTSATRHAGRTTAVAATRTAAKPRPCPPTHLGLSSVAHHAPPHA